MRLVLQNASQERLSSWLTTQAASLNLTLRMLGPRGWLVAIIATGVALVVIGVPTAIIGTPLFIRMTEVRIQDYAIWIASALLAGLIAGTFAINSATSNSGGALSGGLLSYLSVGCPICNKLVVLALGTSGALTFFAPAQLFIGLASVALLAWTLMLRSDAIIQGCEVRRALSEA